MYVVVHFNMHFHDIFPLYITRQILMILSLIFITYFPLFLSHSEYDQFDNRLILYFCEQVAISTPNVKFLAHVQTLQRNTFVQDENDPNKTHMDSTIAFKWPKKSLLKKFIISQSTSEAKKSMKIWGGKMHERLTKLQEEKKRESLSTNSTT